MCTAGLICLLLLIVAFSYVDTGLIESIKLVSDQEWQILVEGDTMSQIPVEALAWSDTSSWLFFFYLKYIGFSNEFVKIYSIQCHGKRHCFGIYSGMHCDFINYNSIKQMRTINSSWQVWEIVVQTPKFDLLQGTNLHNLQTWHAG